VSRLALAFVVALLTFGASGAPALVVAEPCAGDERPSSDDGTCPPTCVTCGCCAQAVEPVVVAAARTPDGPISEVKNPLPRLATADPRPVLHVPRLRAA
jgi:hypothetical protein